jgi:hypothetical protein
MARGIRPSRSNRGSSTKISTGLVAGRPRWHPGVGELRRARELRSFYDSLDYLLDIHSMSIRVRR